MKAYKTYLDKNLNQYVVFTSYEDALEVTGDPSLIFTTNVFETLQEYKDWYVDLERTLALSKLTLHERQLLGL